MSRSKITIPARRVPQIQRPSVGPSGFGGDGVGTGSAPGRSRSPVAAYREHRLLVLPALHGIGGWDAARVAVPASHRRFAVTRARWCVWMHLSPLLKATLPFAAPEWPPYEAQSRSHMVQRVPGASPRHPCPCRPLISPRLSPHSVPFSHPLSPRPMSRTCSWHPRRRRELPHQPEPS